MAGYELSVATELVPGLLNGPDGLAKRVETVLDQRLEAQVTETLGAARFERAQERAGDRNGSRPRTLYTRGAGSAFGAAGAGRELFDGPLQTRPAQ